VGEFDLLRETVRRMPEFIEQQSIEGLTHWCIWNETTAGENFAEKWNADPKLAKAFFSWHAKLEKDLDSLLGIEGLDHLTKRLTEYFGSGPVTKAVRALTDDVTRARAEGRLTVAPIVGLSVGTGLGSTVHPNTFFGVE
jgi:hypothetical protein